MSFFEQLSQIVALLQREGRVSYRALKREFGLDDDFLEDVKEERTCRKFAFSRILRSVHP